MRQSAIPRTDIRRLRSQQLVAAIMGAVDPFLSDERHAREDAYNALAKLLHSEGAEVITDSLRDEIGLPPRGPDGWTAEEIVALERRRLEMLARPLAMTIPAGFTTPG